MGAQTETDMSLGARLTPRFVATVVSLALCCSCTPVDAGRQDKVAAPPWIKCANLSWTETRNQWFDGKPPYEVQAAQQNVAYRVTGPESIEVRVPAVVTTRSIGGEIKEQRRDLVTLEKGGVQNVTCWPPAPPGREQWLGDKNATALALLGRPVEELGYWCRNVGGDISGFGSNVQCSEPGEPPSPMAEAQIVDGVTSKVWLHGVARDDFPAEVPGVVFEWFDDRMSFRACDPDDLHDAARDECRDRGHR